MGIQELIISLAVWVGAYIGVAIPSVDPIVVFISQEKMHYMLHPGVEYDPEGTDATATLGLYVNDHIYLGEDWDAENVIHRSYLVHELVHHFQAYDGRKYACKGEMEPLAYEAMFEYLRENGVAEPMEAIGVNGLFIALVSICPRESLRR